MALRLGTALIETRVGVKLGKLETAIEKVMAELAWERTYEGKAVPEADPGDGAAQFVLHSNDDGLAAVTVDEDKVVRDLARLLSERLEAAVVVLQTTGSLFGRRSVEVVCRRYEYRTGEYHELPVMPTHTRDVSDVEHNELRQVENALKSRIRTANESLLRTEGTPGFVAKKVVRYRRMVAPVKFSSPRLGRLMEQIEDCESFTVAMQGAQAVVKLLLPAGAKTMSYLKLDELQELEKAVDGRPELKRRQVSAD